MDSLRDFPSEFEPAGEAAAPDQSSVAAIGTDERRMHVRAYNYWVSLLDGRDYPSIEDLEPGDLSDFAPHSVLLDFTSSPENPATPYVGAAIREECGITDDIQTIDNVPSRSLLSRLTDHYMQIIANRAPVGFEAEFVNQRRENICYRGILMPFSSDGDTIDFIYGVINWKTVEQGEQTAPVAAPVAVGPLEVEPEPDFDEPLELTQSFAPDTSIEGPAVDLPSFELDEDAALADRLWAARESVEAVKAAEGRSREALYHALASAYDFAVASKSCPEDYAELLEDSGVKPQARAPMTPIVKLVFGIDYDKARLTEYAAALSYAERQQVEPGGFLAFIEAQAGGLKALVAAERLARRPEAKPDTRAERARARLRSAPPLSLADIPATDEFALVLTRRSDQGGHEVVAVVEDPAMVERAIRGAGA
ncbi:MAG TPA: hypothetical protein VFP53_10010 [Sphingomicrobium sp.]|nr:hypothetical protein [Sphingomicrobium sp.]